MVGLSDGYRGCVGGCTRRPKATPISTANSTRGVALGDTVREKLHRRTGDVASRVVRRGSNLRVVGRRLVPTLGAMNRKFRGKAIFLPRLLVDTRTTGATFTILGRGVSDDKRIRRGGKGVVLTAMGKSVRSVNGGVIGILLRGCDFSIVSLKGSIPPRAVISAMLRRSVRLMKLDTLVAAAIMDVRRAVERLERGTPRYLIVMKKTILGRRCTSVVKTSFCNGSTVRSIRCTREIFKAGR